MKTKINILKKELLRLNLMHIKINQKWGPYPIICCQCKTWPKYEK